MGTSSNTILKLGSKVKCSSYIKTKKTKYVCANERHLKKTFGEYSEMFMQNDEFIIIGDDEEYVEQETKEIINVEYEGIVIARKKVSLSNLYEYLPINYIFEDAEQVRVSKQNYIDCVVVAFRMNGTRTVPIDDITLINE